MTAKSNFEDNFKKLEKLSAELSDGKISIDDLVPKMKEAVESIKICKEVLRETRSQLQQISQEFVELEKGEG